MNIIIDPNISYLILVGGFLLAILALFSPGTGILEVGAVLAILFAGYSIATLPFNWWALVILIIGVFPFLIAVRQSKKLVYLAVSIVAFVVGSIFLFRLENGRLAIDPILASVVSILVIGFMWLITTKGLEALQLIPHNDAKNVVDHIGVARSDVHLTGTVFVKNEEWSARAAEHISSGTKIKVINRVGFTLEVEPYFENGEDSDLLRDPKPIRY